MRITLLKLLASLTDKVPFPAPIYEFGSFRVPGQEHLPFVRDFFPGQRFVGCDARTGPGVDEIQDLHALDLPDGNRTTDTQVIEVADREQRVVVTKDADFVNTHTLRGQPAKLLLVSTGNISNQELEVPLIPDLVREFQVNSFLELGRAGIIVRG